MRRQVPAAGNAGNAGYAAFAARAAALAASLALVACAGNSGEVPPRAGQGLLVPVFALTGGWLAGESQDARTPRVLQQVLVPTAVAMNGPDLFYVDAALGALLRYDAHLQLLRRLGVARAWAGVRLWAMPDASLYVLDPRVPSLVRMTRDGRVLGRTTDPAVLSGVAEFTVIERTGQLLLVDRGHNRLRLLSPTFSAAIDVPLERSDRLRLDAIWSVATGKDAWYVIDRSRRQVVRIDSEGRLLQAFGEAVLKLPSAIGVDRFERVFVADQGSQAIHVFTHGGLTQSIAGSALGVSRILDLRVSDSTLVLSGDGGAGIRVFHLLPPAQAAS